MKSGDTHMKTLRNTDTGLDRRQRKTRYSIEVALLELMKEKSISEITISELANAADVNRKTFYNHFKSVNEVLKSIEEGVVTTIFSMLPEKITVENKETIYDMLKNITDRMEEQMSICQLLNESGEHYYLSERLKEQLLPYVEFCFSSYLSDNSLIPYINQYMLSGLISLFSEWFKAPEKFSKERITMLAYSMTISLLNLDNYKDLHKK
jgi:AcrR family transcriptional regulator